MPLTHTSELFIPATHPVLPGHFPGQPIVPGALLLDTLLASSAPANISSLQRVRFSAAVQPGVALQVNWQAKGDDWRFSVSQAGREVCRGNASASEFPTPLPSTATALPFIDADASYRKLPHSGAMRLLQQIASDGEQRAWGMAEIRADNPLLRNGELSAWCGLEYAAQLLACYGSLQQGELRSTHIVMARALHSYQQTLSVGSKLYATIRITSRQSDALSAEFLISNSNRTALCGGEFTALFG